jgi:hypothetical protein
MPAQGWSGTRETLHRFLQVVGKVRLDQAPPRNHWWHVPFHLTGRGLTTRPMGSGVVFSIDFDFVAHRLVIDSLSGASTSFSLPGLSVAAFHERLFAGLRGIEVRPHIRAVPFDLTDSTPFAEDHLHAEYDEASVVRYWQVLSWAWLLLERYAGWCTAKTSPVHHFWHSFDLAVTRFSDRVVPHGPEVDGVTRQAYSHEAISAGFWFGDKDFPAPAFYSYTAPEPDGLAGDPLVPAAASWVPSRGGHLAVLPYEDVRTAPDPAADVLAFLDSAYLAGARRAGWDTELLRSAYAPPLTPPGR